MEKPQLDDDDARVSMGSEPERDSFFDPDRDKALYEKLEAGVLHWVKLIAILFIPLLASACVLVYVLHILLPEGWRWLREEDLSSLRSLSVSVLAGVISSVAIGYFVPKK